MQITLIASASLARALRGSAAHPVRAAVAKAKATLYPPPTDDTASAMARTFVIEAPARAAPGLAAALAAMPGVEACYAKPADAPP